jgi:hypothetical protein
VSPDEAAIATLMATELLGKTETMDVSFRPLTVFQLTAMIQLALRHPRLSPELRKTAEALLAAVREYFADCPTVLDVVRRGDDPAEDVSR